MGTYVKKQAELLARAADAVRACDPFEAHDWIDASYRLDVARGEGWRDRVDCQRAMAIRLALIDCMTEQVKSYSAKVG